MTGRRIIFMGTPDFACPTLQILLDRRETVLAVVTQPDRPKGRGQKLMPPPVKELALQHHIPVLQPARVREPEFVAVIREYAPDLIVVVAFGQILPKALLEIPPMGCVNVHSSLLPRYPGRGAAQLVYHQWRNRNRGYHHADGSGTGYRPDADETIDCHR